ncbi:MAG: RluA family pseudouridine synthase [Treponema sp.]|jgi:23S rRNA pseudouridine955/2504/2580 synthase|nr:RluA family pseudouridine synthase [Treponema sp.]
MKFPDIIYEDEYILVLNKPSGLAVQGGSGVAVSMDDMLKKLSPRPLLVHRLDRDTSGVLITAKSAREAARCEGVFLSGGAGKHYRAVCAGEPPQTGIIAGGLTVRGREKYAHTSFTLVSSGDLAALFNKEEELGRYSLLEITITTGRMHQIRRQLAASGWPVLGDDKYGDFSLNRRLKKSIGVKRLMLHAYMLRFPAANGAMLEFRAPIPGAFLPYLKPAAGG